MCKICSKLPGWSQWRRSSVFTINFENISHIVLVFSLLTLNRQILAGESRFFKGSRLSKSCDHFLQVFFVGILFLAEKVLGTVIALCREWIFYSWKLMLIVDVIDFSILLKALYLPCYNFHTYLSDSIVPGRALRIVIKVRWKQNKMNPQFKIKTFAYSFQLNSILLVLLV